MKYTNQTNSESRKCLRCNNIFYKLVNCSRKEWEQNYKYCSRSCSKIGKPSWVKGKKRTWESSGDFKKGQIPWNKGKKYEQITNEKNPLWKGETASLTAKHDWLKRRYGKPSKCEHCGTTELRMYHWANISGEYKRDISDWKRLCVPCHKRFDLTKLKNK